tara:strand:- start:214 stop:369 length:156 start_codon:yes stop_codon:yes gene_type:complete
MIKPYEYKLGNQGFIAAMILIAKHLSLKALMLQVIKKRLLLAANNKRFFSY